MRPCGTARTCTFDAKFRPLPSSLSTHAPTPTTHPLGSQCSGPNFSGFGGPLFSWPSLAKTDFGQNQLPSLVKTEFGQNRVWPNRVWPNYGVCVCGWLLCVLCVLDLLFKLGEHLSRAEASANAIRVGNLTSPLEVFAESLLGTCCDDWWRAIGRRRANSNRAFPACLVNTETECVVHALQ